MLERERSKSRERRGKHDQKEKVQRKKKVVGVQQNKETGKGKPCSRVTQENEKQKNQF